MSRTKRTPDRYEDKPWKAAADHKRYPKPPAFFKAITKAKRRAKEDVALVRISRGEEIEVPRFRKSDIWSWT